MRLSTILESPKIWQDKWFDTKWADQVKMRELDDPIKVIYSTLFEDAFSHYPKSIVDHMIVEHNYLQGGNTILDSVNWGDVEMLEELFEDHHPSPDEMFKELVDFGKAFNQLYEELKKNDTALRSLMDNFGSYDRYYDRYNEGLSGIDLDYLSTMSKELGRLEIYLGDDKMYVEPLTPARNRPLMRLFGSIHTKYNTIKYPIETMLSEKLIVKLWEEIVMKPGIFTVIHAEGFLPKTKKVPCLSTWGNK